MLLYESRLPLTPNLQPWIPFQPAAAAGTYQEMQMFWRKSTNQIKHPSSATTAMQYQPCKAQPWCSVPSGSVGSWLMWLLSHPPSYWKSHGCQMKPPWTGKRETSLPFSRKGERKTITESSELEGTFKVHLTQFSHNDQRHLQLDQGAQSSECLQGWNMHHLSGQPVLF